MPTKTKALKSYQLRPQQAYCPSPQLIPQHPTCQSLTEVLALHSGGTCSLRSHCYSMGGP